MADNLWKCKYWQECGEPCIVTDKQMNSNKALCEKNKNTAWQPLEADTCKYHDTLKCYDMDDCKSCINHQLN